MAVDSTTRQTGPDDAGVRVRVELGRSRVELRDLPYMAAGRVVTLDCLCDDDVDIYADGQLLARGEPVVVDGKFAVRVREMV